MMPKGKPWTVEEERELKQLIEAGCNAYNIAVRLGKAPNAVYEKAKRLGLKVIISSQKRKIITSNVELPEDLPSIEEALKTLNKALKALETPGLDQAETLRLGKIIQGVKIYKEIFADYLDYRGLEIRLVELEGKYAALVKKAPTSPAA